VILAVACVAFLVAGCLAGAGRGPSPSPIATATQAPPTPTRAPTPAPTPTPEPTPVPTPVPTLEQLVGQKLVVGLGGTTPSAALLDRIAAGEIGGVILFGANITTPEALTALTERLHAAARDGGQPPLLVTIDQEGGIVKRIPWGPPDRTPRVLGADGRATEAYAEGKATGALLAALGINVNLAPVADVPATTSSFMYRQGRTWSFDAAATADLSVAFAEGLRDAGVLPAFKHFPGIGFATPNTDLRAVTITASAVELEPGLLPFRVAADRDMPLIMLSNAAYRAWDASAAAGWSSVIANDLLRDDVGFAGATITDALEDAARSRGMTTHAVATLAAGAGTDLLLMTGTEPSTAVVYERLLGAARDGTIPRAVLEASYERILALKALLAP